jgi:VIT1/CCC1 family predicted Fe2+/Mn2+ transporter
MDEALKARLVEAQRNELTEYHVYRRLADINGDPHNRAVLERIAEDEKKHYDFWSEKTGLRPPLKRLRLWWYVVVGRVLGLIFAVRLMERGEEEAQRNYRDIAPQVEGAEAVVQDEHRHEEELADLLDEERLRYASSVVLGLSDALVELTGALAGLTLALRDPQLIAASGLITGIAAALSMGVSEYLSTKAGAEPGKTPLKASLYTGGAYLLTVTVLVMPFLLIPEPLMALPLTLGLAVLIIAGFTFYHSVAKGLSFRHRFGEMAGLSLGVAAVSFGIGYLVRILLDVEV